MLFHSKEHGDGTCIFAEKQLTRSHYRLLINHQTIGKHWICRFLFRFTPFPSLAYNLYISNMDISYFQRTVPFLTSIERCISNILNLPFFMFTLTADIHWSQTWISSHNCCLTYLIQQSVHSSIWPQRALMTWTTSQPTYATNYTLSTPNTIIPRIQLHS